MTQKNVTRALEKFTEHSIQTKAYLHVDKELFAAGETIWFKSYLISEPSGFLDTLNSNLYVELVDNKSRVIKRQTLFLQTGLGNGSMEIPADVLSGLYYLRAYTSWMRNFDEAFYFIQPIEVQNLEQDFEVYQPPVADTLIDLQFFPEGGDLIAGTTTKLAFKAIDHKGHGRSLRATIFDANADSVTTIETRNAGMGALEFKPEKYQYYYAQIEGQMHKYDLPMVKDEGYSMRVDNGYENLISVRLTKVGQKGDREPFLMVQADGKVYSFVSDIRLDEKGQAVLSLPKASLPSGISQITLFNAEGLPECERLVFIDKEDMLGIGIRMQKEYGKREQVIIDFQVRDAAGKPRIGSFSLAVVDENYQRVNRFSGNIASEFLLTSDLKGAIEEPLQYFDKENPTRKEDLDLLMMTHGWRRFTWKELLEEPQNALPYSVESGLTISGRAFYNKKKKPALMGGTVTYFNLDDFQTQANIADIGPDGRFTFDELIFEKGSQAAIKAADEKGRENILLEIQQSIVETNDLPERSLEWLYYPQQKIIGDSIDDNKPVLLLSGDYRDLGSVTVTGSKDNSGRTAKKIPKTGSGSRVFDVDEMLKNTSGQRSVLDLLVGKLPGLSVVRLGSSVEDVVVKDTRGNRKIANGVTSSQPLYILDGQTIEQDMAANIPANVIETLEVFIGPSAALYGVRGMNGVIVMTSKEGVDAWSGPPILGLAKLESFGYDYSREFYSPQYDLEDEMPEEPDRRTLLYWAPNIVTNDIGQAQVSFYTGDLEGTYVIDLQGMGVNGKPGVLKRSTFKVK